MLISSHGGLKNADDGCFQSTFSSDSVYQFCGCFPTSTSLRDSPFTIPDQLVHLLPHVYAFVLRNLIQPCPICYNSLAALTSHPNGSVESPAPGTQLQCKTCKNSYSSSETHLDLAMASGTKHYTEPLPLSIELFRNPLVSFLYERGWRQNFMWGGFPGPEKEMAKEYLKHVLGGNIIDASCGSGMFSRLFAKSEHFAMVFALDYSENMLRQCYEFLKQEANLIDKKMIVLARADIARLPFLSGSVDAVHAGAALHCWPSPSSAVAEISRVLRPGGVFVATTFIYDGLSVLYRS
ncbi:hypothetical protein Bca4012_058233 [Brassica carinata]